MTDLEHRHRELLHNYLTVVAERDQLRIELAKRTPMNLPSPDQIACLVDALYGLNLGDEDSLEVAKTKKLARETLEGGLRCLHAYFLALSKHCFEPEQEQNQAVLQLANLAAMMKSLKEQGPSSN